jgi:L-amino acid N-acyltransferase YncA
MVVNSVCLPDGAQLAVRPLGPGDGERLRRLCDRLSPETIYRRFHAPVRPGAALVARLLDLDHRDREALAAMSGDEVVAVARYARVDDRDTAEVAVTVEDAWQRRGVGRALLERLAALARERGIRTFRAVIAAENPAAIELLRTVAPSARFHWEHGGAEAEMPLAPASQRQTDWHDGRVELGRQLPVSR